VRPGEWLTTRAASLPAAVFSVVMATGIVSTAADLLGLAPVAWALFGLNCILYLTLAALSLLRAATASVGIRTEFRDHAMAPAFFTLVAGTCVLGTEFVVLVGSPTIAGILWCVGIVLWLALTYAFFTIMTVVPEKPRLEEGMNASWMLIVVATQSVSLLGTLLAPLIAVARGLVLGFTTVLFLLGCIFYLLLFSLILYRFLFFPFDPERLTPPYWINMGAVAITTLSGSLLVLRAGEWEFLRDILPFLKGFTLLFWATATWWIPLLLILGAWRHVARRIPLRYDLQYWSMIFPLGMYSVATFRLTEALAWPTLAPLAYLVGYLAIVAWTVVALGFVARRWWD
jgi:tellurite resistance protein TehA-like permease